MEPAVSKVPKIQRLRTRREVVMDINFSTKNLIVSNYQSKAGGKLINMASALHPNILLQDERLARSKMTGEQDVKTSFDMIWWTFAEKKRTGDHIEFGCVDLTGFHGGQLEVDITHDDKASNTLWRQLTNQEKFYFFMVDHGKGTAFERYINRRTLRLRNFEWLVAQRGDDADLDTQPELPNQHTVDMSSIQDRVGFNKEIRAIFDFINLPQPSEAQVFDQCLEDIRKGFLETYKIGFNKGETNDR
jgi:hypothetical protein